VTTEPDRRALVREIAIYAGLVLLAGAVFVALRVAREGTRVLDYDVRPSK
jgi:hypothetical protein